VKGYLWEDFFSYIFKRSAAVESTGMRGENATKNPTGQQSQWGQKVESR
jgi:hypothetical protein